ncbi:plasminogen-binding N-terminal domain-containing protein [Sulfurimonas sp.]|nr:plasminogen-binding N-terminal domain-containing protein [Sulfurimonas sp.]
MKYIFLVLFIVIDMFGGVIKSTIIGVNEDKTEATVEVDYVDVGVNGFVVHQISEGRSQILNNAVVKSFNPDTKIAKLQLDEYGALVNNALPSGKWTVSAGDTVVLAFGYTRGLLLAPSEEIYHRVTKSARVQWVHPDLFATLLSFNGHPTPLREDFTKMSIDNSVGLLYIYLHKKVYTADVKSFKILAISDADLKQDKEPGLPFYTRVPEINANWFGAGSWHLSDYEPHYYELLIEANPKNMELYNNIKALGEDFDDLLEEFEIKG